MRGGGGAAAVHCFQMLQKPGAEADDLLAAAKAVHKKNLAPMGDMTCTADAVRLLPCSCGSWPDA